MADLVITASAVLAGADATIVHGVAAATITAGQWVYRDSNGNFPLADSNSATALARTPVGMALNGASSGQPLAVLTGGDVTLNAVMTAGLPYFLSDTPGGMCPVADVGSGEYSTTLGIAESTTVFHVDINASGFAS